MSDEPSPSESEGEEGAGASESSPDKAETQPVDPKELARHKQETQAVDSRQLMKMSSTQKIIHAVEKKVSAQWKKATGGFLAFSAGFSWKQDEDGPKEIGRRLPTGKYAQGPSRTRWILGVALVLGLAGGVTAWIVYLKQKQPAPTGPLFPR